ncbi:hypothetical protein GC176_08495 [bacterium]|nr:hypothetical protein [bacterium]
MTSVLAILLGISVVALLVTLYELNRRLNAHCGRGLLGRWKIPTTQLANVDSIFAESELGVSFDCEVRFLGGQATGTTSEQEGWILAVLSKQARRLFEFGTCTGRTTWLWAANSPADARITTLTLSPDELATYRAEPGDSRSDTHNAQVESAFQQFLYSDTDVEDKIEQLFGDSKDFDPEPYAESMDLIFVDGSHAYSYVLSDTEKALRMLKPGGLLLWHDYRGPFKAGDVFRALNELSDRLPLQRIRETSLVMYRKPEAAAEVSHVVRRAA